MLNGRITKCELSPGASIWVWGDLATLPAGVYELTLKASRQFDQRWAIGLGTVHKTFRVVDDPALRQSTLAQLADRIRDGDDFAASLAVRYRIRELLDVVYTNLASDDDECAYVAADSLLRVYSDPPSGLRDAIAAGLQRNPKPSWQSPRDYNIDPWVKLLCLAQRFPDDRYVPNLIKLTSPQYGYAREYALKALAGYHAPAATDALRSFITDESPTFREIAVCAFALRHDPVAIEPLIKLSHEKWYDGHPWVYGALAQFPDDPQAVGALQAARNSIDDRVRNAANKPTVQIPP